MLTYTRGNTSLAVLDVLNVWIDQLYKKVNRALVTLAGNDSGTS